jgi:predicted amidophosphoribosyltransferase
MSPRILKVRRCPHCKAELSQPAPRVCPSCGGSLQQRYLVSGCLTSAPKLLLLGWIIVECWRAL